MSTRPNLYIKTERLKVLKVIGEAVAQVVVEGETKLKAKKIEKIEAKLGPVSDHVFKDKVVKQGVILKQIIFVDHDDYLRHAKEEIPFMTSVTIPGLKPGDDIEIQNHLLNIDTDFQFEPAGDDKGKDKDKDKEGKLRQKIVAHILVKAAQWRQVDVVTDVHLYPRLNAMGRRFCSD